MKDLKVDKPLVRVSHCADSVISRRKAKLCPELAKRFARRAHPPAFYVRKTLLDGRDKFTLRLGFQHESPQIVIHLQTLCPGICEHADLSISSEISSVIAITPVS